MQLSFCLKSFPDTGYSRVWFHFFPYIVIINIVYESIPVAKTCPLVLLTLIRIAIINIYYILDELKVRETHEHLVLISTLCFSVQACQNLNVLPFFCVNCFLGVWCFDVLCPSTSHGERQRTSKVDRLYLTHGRIV